MARNNKRMGKQPQNNGNQPQPTTAGTSTQAQRDEFARRLQTAMLNKGLSNSDLARAVWGETEDSKGYKVARNRDRVAVYLAGKGFPEMGTLHKLAGVLGVSKEDLAPHVTMVAVDRERPAFSMTMAPGQGTEADVQLNMRLPLSVAVQISQLVTSVRQQGSMPGIDSDLEDEQ